MSWNYTPEELGDLVKNRDVNETKELNDKFGGLPGLAQSLKTDLKHGLSADENIEERRAHFGPNILPTKKPPTYFEFLFDALQDRTLIILMIASVVSIILGVTLPPPGEDRSTGWIEGTAILIAVLIVSNVTATNDFTKDRKFRKLSAKNDEDKKITVVRGGKEQEITVGEVVVGDVCILETGNYIPADLLLVQGQGLSSDESAMTGEPEQVPKNEHDPWLLSGTLVTTGSGKGIAIAVGAHSQWGKIKAALEKGESETPLQSKLEHMAENIGKLGVIAAILTLIGLILKWSIERYGINEDEWKWNELGRLVSFFITAITIIVVAVPEGLPLAVTLALAYSMIQMMKDQNLVRHLAACETMGGATQICSDKTGTLTQNLMTVIKVKVGDIVIEDFPEEGAKREIPGNLKHLITEGICINSSAYIEKGENNEKPKFVGLKTECALLVMSEILGVEYKKVRDDLDVVLKFPFSSKKKRMSTLIKTEKGYRLYCKGASEIILDLCNTMLDEEGKEVDIKPEKQNLRSLIDEWAGMGYRTLSLSYKDFPADFVPPTLEAPKKPIDGENLEDAGDDGPLDTDLILIGLVGIEDPIRREVPDAVASCQKAGITVRMLTGDNILTASKIAKSCGILKEDGVAIEGPKFRNLSKEEIDKLVPNLQVIARCSPQDKLILVKRLRELGEVVAVTGDGTNDAPILTEADVGFAMGISGTEVAKSACDIIILDDNFASIVKAVLWGRNVFDSIRKFLQFQLTVNIVAVLTAFLGAITTGESPLKAVQLLWVNLIMDTMAALALATEMPGPELMDRPPTGRNSRLITNKMWRMIIGQAIFQLAVLLFTLYGIQEFGFLGVKGGAPVTTNYDEEDEGHEDLTRSTIVFNTFVLCQLFNEINCRKLGSELNCFKNIHKNYIFGAVIVISVAVQILIIEFGQRVTQTEALNGEQWAFCIIVGAISIPYAILLRLIPIPDEKQPKPGEESEPLIPIPKWLPFRSKDEDVTIEMEESGRKPRSAMENWKLAREAMLDRPQHHTLVELIRKTHHRGTTFGQTWGTKKYTFMENN